MPIFSESQNTMSQEESLKIVNGLIAFLSKIAKKSNLNFPWVVRQTLHTVMNSR